MKMEKLLEIISNVSTEALETSNKEEMRKLAGTLIDEALRKEDSTKEKGDVQPDMDGSS